MLRLFCFFLLFAPLLGTSQSHWVFLSGKAGARFNPLEYFDQKAIDRRLREGISLSDSTDFPLSTAYVSIITEMVDSVSGHSRWLNALAVEATDSQMERVRQLPFVSGVEAMQTFAVFSSLDSTLLDKEQKMLLKNQTEHLGASVLKEHGLNGKGVRIAILDGGFRDMKENEAFEKIIANKQVKATWDFVKNKLFVFNYSDHGTHVLSCVAGDFAGIPMGLAPGAEFILARVEQTEDAKKVREQNWVMALEWADKNGADIVNSSLVYTRQLYFRDDMTGRVSAISKAANMALGKGVLVVNSAGNEGYSPWEIIGAPADADSVLTIGAIDPYLGYHADFSSYGPTADNRMKPNLCAFGTTLVADGDGVITDSGTSFAAPLVTGFAACIRQLHPEYTARKLFNELQLSGDLYPYYDYAHGFGLPRVAYFFDATHNDTIPTLQSVWNGDFQSVEFKEIGQNKMDENGHKSINDRSKLAFLHIENEQGRLEEYRVFSPENGIAAALDYVDCWDCIIRVFYKNFILETTKRELTKRKEESHE
ncbi:MAG: S8 family serine peptidase [Flavobacteriales bacterium]